MNLFKCGHHILHSGQESWWKIDCDALTGDDIDTLAMLIADLTGPFGSVEGVPQGGLRLATRLRQYQTAGRLLIVDDVWTTGASMEEWRAGREAIGAVIFARSTVHPWVTALFQYWPPRFEPYGRTTSAVYLN